MKYMKLCLRVMVIGGVMLLLLVALLMIRGIGKDRTYYRMDAVGRVSNSTAGAQQVAGPLRVVPWTAKQRVEIVASDGGKRIAERTYSGYLVQTPKTLHMEGNMKPDVRRIGLYDVRIYELQSNLKATFDAFEARAVPDRVYGEPYLVIGVMDMRGLVGTPVLRMNGHPLAMEPGTRDLSAHIPGMHAKMPLPSTDTDPAPLSSLTLPADEVELDMNLLGTQSLAISPVADDNRIDLHSSWPHPSFSGRFLPNERTIDAGGFAAQWQISSLASQARAQLSGVEGTARLPPPPETASAYDHEQASNWTAPTLAQVEHIDIALIDPVDIYTQVDRASKYGILFIVLTFVAFMLFELIKRLPIHPLQYLLVGLALAIFFLLLLGLSEHMPFWKAYLIAALACIALQFFYLTGVLKNWLRAGGFAAMLTALYGVLYSLLISEDNALLMGSLLLFGVLAAIMMLTRKVDWYELTGTN